MRAVRALLLAVPLFLLAGPAPAATVTYHFSGVTNPPVIDDFNMPVVNPTATTFAGSVSWDPDAPSNVSGGVIAADIPPPIAPNGLSITVDRFALTFVADPQTLLFVKAFSQVQNHDNGQFDVSSQNLAVFADLQESISISLATTSGFFDFFNPTIPVSLDLADFEMPVVFISRLDFDGVTVTSFSYSGTITSLNPAIRFTLSAVCGAIPGEGVELCGDVAEGGLFFGRQVPASEIDEAAAAALASLQTGDTAQIWDLSLDGVLTGDGGLTFTYDPALLGAGGETGLGIAHYDAGLGQWNALPTPALNTALDTITVETQGFSLFVVTVLGAADVDGDSVPDAGGAAPCQTGETENCFDNCVFEPNNTGDDIQRDTDGNGRGDACECGNVDKNEKVDIFDALHIAQGTLTPPLIEMIHPRACDADGNGRCDIFDALRVAQATLTPPLAQIVQQCDAATVVATP